MAGVFDGSDGFLAFDGALLLPPPSEQIRLRTDPAVRFLLAKSGGGELFALDLFGGVFAVLESGVVRVDPETGDVSAHSNSVDEWASVLIEHPNFELGFSLAQEWKLQGRPPVGPSIRLMPKQPFVLGGDYVVENLVSVELSDAFRYYALLAKEIQDAGEGQSVVVPQWPRR